MAVITVIIPTHNRFEVTLRAVTSAQNQTFKDVQIIIIDDCSSDGSFEKLKSYFKESTVSVLGSSTNVGAATCRNIGAEHAVGKYVAFLDSDDIWMPEKLEFQFRRFLDIEAKNYGDFLIYSPAILEYCSRGAYVNPTRPIEEDELVEDYLFIEGQDIQTSGWFMPLETFNKVKFTPGLRRHQDLDFCLRAQAQGIKFFMTAQPLYKRGHASSETHVGKVRDDGISDVWIEGVRPMINKYAYHHFCLETILPAVVDSNPKLARRLIWNGLCQRAIRLGTLKYYIFRIIGFNR